MPRIIDATVVDMMRRPAALKTVREKMQPNTLGNLCMTMTI